jgi:hypothetical protein
MDILVTLIATDSNVPEAPFFSFPVAIKAWCRQVCAIKWKFAEVMLLNGEGEKCKPFGIVTS